MLLAVADHKLDPSNSPRRINQEMLDMEVCQPGHGHPLGILVSC